MEQPKIKRIDNEEELRKQVEKCRIVISHSNDNYSSWKNSWKRKIR